MSMQFTISACGKRSAVPIQMFIKRHFSHIPLEQIESFFGFTEASTLYGGRNFAGPEIGAYDLCAMYKMNIILPMSANQDEAFLQSIENKEQITLRPIKLVKC